MNNFSRPLGAILLVAGTAIGAGMLALPLQTASFGFIPSCFAFIVCGLFMALAALLLLEVNLWLPAGSNLIAMAQYTLGKPGKALAWASYLLLLYALLSAYLKAITAWAITLMQEVALPSLGEAWIMTTIALLTGLAVRSGTRNIDYFNRFLSLGLIVAYATLVFCAVPELEFSLLNRQSYSGLQQTIPLMITSFGFSIVIPSLSQYLKREAKSLVWVIIGGTAVILSVYLIWELTVFALLPFEGPEGLAAITHTQDNGTAVVLALQHKNQTVYLGYSARIFAICAIFTSFLGVSLSAFHFLEEALQLRTKRSMARFAMLATFVPPVICALASPKGFEAILSFSAIFVAFLLGIIPAWMVWRGRYGLQIQAAFRVPGGKVLLLAVWIFFLWVIFYEIYRSLLA